MPDEFSRLAADIELGLKRLGEAFDPRRNLLMWILSNPERAVAELHAHRDESAVRGFAELMIAKMARARAKGRSGWQLVSVDELWQMLREHVEKGDPVDVANIAMMIHHNTQADLLIATHAGGERS